MPHRAARTKGIRARVPASGSSAGNGGYRASAAVASAAAMNAAATLATAAKAAGLPFKLHLVEGQTGGRRQAGGEVDLHAGEAAGARQPQAGTVALAEEIARHPGQPGVRCEQARGGRDVG